MKKHSFVVTSMALVALALGAASCGRGDSAPAKEEKASVRVRAEAIAPASERARMELSGELVARDRIDVATKVAGRIVELPVTEGTVVRRGDVLARLDSPELASAVAQSKAAEQAARLNAEMSERQAERFRRLAASEVVTPRDLEMMEVAAAGAKASHEQARAMATMSQQNLDYAVLRAPRDGVVVRRFARAGDLALPGQPVVAMEDPGSLEIRITLPAEAQWPVAPDDSASVTVTLTGDTAYPAVVDRVTPGADRHTIEAYLRADGVRAPSGSFVRATLFGAGNDDALRLPAEALVRRGPLTGVFLVQDGRAALRWVRLAADGRVTAGIASGSSVILAPPADLEDGDAVEVAR